MTDQESAFLLTKLFCSASICSQQPELGHCAIIYQLKLK